MLLAQIGSIVGFATYPSALVEIKNEWLLSNFESGLIASSFFFGYILIVPLATTLTDRIDARRIYIAGTIASILGLLGMSFLAIGFFSAMACLILSGAGVSATYMPGLKILSDRVKQGELTRHISFYTAFFGVGTALSYFSSGLLIHQFGWRAAFLVAALGPLTALLIVLFFVSARDGEGGWLTLKFKLADIFPVGRWKRVMQTEDAMSYMLGYAAHSLELFATRSWMVTYFVFCATIANDPDFFPIAATSLVAMINLAGVPASIFGNEMALRVGRQRWIIWVMLTSAIFGLLVGWAPGMPWFVIVLLVLAHSLCVMADSATLTAGLVISVPQEIKGVALGLHSLLGFAGGLIGPALFGAALDASALESTDNHQPSWLIAYLSIVSFSVLFALLKPFKKRRQDGNL